MIILTKKHLDAEVKEQNLVAGQFRLVVRGPAGDIRRDTGWFDNLILDSGLNRWGTGIPVLGVAIGTNATAPAVGQTGLIAQAAYTTTSVSTDSGNLGAPDYISFRTQTYRFSAGTLNGTYAEIGAGWASGANMFSRALIVDILGVPAPVTVGITESLDVSYSFRCYPALTDVVSVVTIGGVSTTVTTRPANVSTSAWGANINSAKGTSILFGAAVYSGAIGAVTTTPSGTATSASSSANVAYVSGSYTLERTATWGLGVGNYAGGVLALRSGFTASETYQHGFSPAIAKDATKTLTLNASCTWARHP